MIRLWVKLFRNHYEQIKKLKKRIGKSLSTIVREAVSQFIKKKDYSINIVAFHLPKTSSDKYKTMNAYFPSLTGIFWLKPPKIQEGAKLIW